MFFEQSRQIPIPSHYQFAAIIVHALAPGLPPPPLSSPLRQSLPPAGVREGIGGGRRGVEVSIYPPSPPPPPSVLIRCARAMIVIEDVHYWCKRAICSCFS